MSPLRLLKPHTKEKTQTKKTIKAECSSYVFVTRTTKLKNKNKKTHHKATKQTHRAREHYFYVSHSGRFLFVLMGVSQKIFHCCVGCVRM